MEQEMMQQGQANGPSRGQSQLLERFVFNAMNIAAGDGYDKMLSMAQSTQNGRQSVARALLFIIKTVVKGLEQKGIEIPGQMYVAENGILSQTARLVTALLLKAGVQIQPEDVPEAIQMVAAQLASEYDQRMSGAEDPQANPEAAAAAAQQQVAAQQQQAMPPQQGAPVPEQPMPPQGGM